MGKYIVGVKEIYIASVEINLTPEEEELPLMVKRELILARANNIVEKEEVDSSYSYTDEPGTWTIARTR